MDEVYPDATRELAWCAHRDLAGRRCLLPPEYRVGDDLFCEAHVRGAVDELEFGPRGMLWCAAETKEGLPCAANPGFAAGDGQLYCVAHYKKLLSASRVQEGGDQE